MSDHQKTKRDLIEELRALRACVSTLEKTAEALQESEAKYKSLIEGVPDVMHTLDAEGNVTFINKAVKAVFGWEPEKLTGKHFSTWVPSEYLPSATALFRRILAGEKVTAETVILDRRGQPRDVEVGATPVMKDGKAVGIHSVFRDITNRKKLEAALQDSEKTLRAMIDAVTQFALLLEVDGTVLIANPATVERLGTSERELIGKCVYDFLPKDVAKSRKRQAGKVIREGKAVHFEDENAGRCIYHSVYPIFDASGNVARLAIFALDFTDRKQAEEELRQSELRYRALFEDVPVGLGLATMDGRVLDCNKAILQMTGYTEAEIKGINVRDTYQDPRQRAQLLQRVRKGGRVEDFEVPLKRKDGTTYYASLSIIRWTLGGEDVLFTVQKDITQRKQAERGLREAEAKYRALVEQVPAINYTAKLDSRSTTVYVSPQFEQILGFAPVDYEADPDLWAKQLHPEDRRRVLADVAQCHQTGKPFMCEYRMIAKDGHTVWLRDHATIVSDSNGKPLALHGVMMDITERKAVEQALQASEAKYRTLLENLPQKIFLKDLNSVYLSCNENLARDFKIQPEEVAGKTDYDFFPKEIAEEYRANDERIVELGRVIEVEETYVHDGQETVVHTVKTPLKDERGNVTGILGIFWDITEQKKAEEQIRRLSSAVEQSMDGIAIVDLQMRLLYVNSAFARMFGYEPQEMIGISLANLHNAEQMVAHQAHIERVKTEGRWDGELDHVGKDGTTFPTYMSVTLLKDSRGQPTGILAVARDITKARQRERELSLYRERITQAEHLASLGTFSAEMVHELTQPLTVVKLSVQNALAALEGPRSSWRSAKPEPGRAGGPAESSSSLVMAKLDDSLDAISDITSVVDRFRNFARRSSDIGLSRVDLNTVGHKIVELLSESARRAKVTVYMKDVDKLPPVYMDARKPEQLFFILIENAIQAADGKEEHTLVIHGGAENRYVTLWFCDDCGGVAPENLERIFEPFFTTKPAGQGTGLGLCVVQRVVSQAGGTIHAESTHGQGTTFTVTLPIGRDVDP